MTILFFIVHLMGATMLLLYAVRMVRTGIERAFGASFKRIVTTTSNPASSASTGWFWLLYCKARRRWRCWLRGLQAPGRWGLVQGLRWCWGPIWGRPC